MSQRSMSASGISRRDPAKSAEQPVVVDHHLAMARPHAERHQQVARPAADAVGEGPGHGSGSLLWRVVEGQRHDRGADPTATALDGPLHLERAADRFVARLDTGDAMFFLRPGLQVPLVARPTCRPRSRPGSAGATRRCEGRRQVLRRVQAFQVGPVEVEPDQPPGRTTGRPPRAAARPGRRRASPCRGRPVDRARSRRASSSAPG